MQKPTSRNNCQKRWLNNYLIKYQGKSFRNCLKDWFQKQKQKQKKKTKFSNQVKI